MAKELTRQELLDMAGHGASLNGEEGGYGELAEVIERLAVVGKQMATRDLVQSVAKDGPTTIEGWGELVAAIERLAKAEEAEVALKAEHRAGYEKKTEAFNRWADNEQARIDAHGELHAAEGRTRDAIINVQREVVMALQKLINGMPKGSSPQVEGALARIETAVAAKESRDNPVYTFEIQRDTRGFMQTIKAIPSPMPTRPGPY